MPIYIGEFEIDLAGVHLSLVSLMRNNTLPLNLNLQYQSLMILFFVSHMTKMFRQTVRETKITRIS